MIEKFINNDNIIFNKSIEKSIDNLKEVALKNPEKSNGLEQSSLTSLDKVLPKSENIYNDLKQEFLDELNNLTGEIENLPENLKSEKIEEISDKLKYLSSEFKNLPENLKEEKGFQELSESLKNLSNKFEDLTGKKLDTLSDYPVEIKENLPIKNKIDGLKREEEVEKELLKQYPEKEGYSIINEAYLRNNKGEIVKDEKIGEARRIDFCVVKEKKVIDMVEVTSKTAPKIEQIAKEYRIRENGGNYIKDKNNELIKIPENVETRIERRE